MDLRESKWSMRFGWLVMGANGFSAIAITLLHGLQPGLDPLVHPISEYVHGEFGFLMTATFFSQSLGSLALGVCVIRQRLNQRRALVGSALLMVSAAGAAVAGVFPADLASPVPQTSAGMIHAAAGLVRFLSLAIALPLLSSALAKHLRFQKVSRALTSLATLFVITFLVSIFALANIGWFGLGQRGFIAILLIWMSLAVYPLIQKRAQYSTAPKGDSEVDDVGAHRG